MVTLKRFKETTQRFVYVPTENGRTSDLLYWLHTYTKLKRLKNTSIEILIK